MLFALVEKVKNNLSVMEDIEVQILGLPNLQSKKIKNILFASVKILNYSHFVMGHIINNETNINFKFYYIYHLYLIYISRIKLKLL